MPVTRYETNICNISKPEYCKNVTSVTGSKFFVTAKRSLFLLYLFFFLRMLQMLQMLLVFGLSGIIELY
jgi:hypothetical protein